MTGVMTGGRSTEVAAKAGFTVPSRCYLTVLQCVKEYGSTHETE